METKTSPQRRFKHRVLLVEDSPESQNLIRQICETIDEGMRLKCVGSAEEAQKILASKAKFDLIISDHYLTGKATGLDLWQYCKDQFKQVPFMLMSSLTNEEFLAKIGDDWNYPLFLQKPFHKQQCQEMIEWYLEISPKMKRKKVRAKRRLAAPAKQKQEQEPLPKGNPSSPELSKNIFQHLMQSIEIAAILVFIAVPSLMEPASAMILTFIKSVLLNAR